MRWGTPNESVEGVDFEEVFAAQGFNAARFLKMDNVIDEVKRQNDKVTEKLIEHTGILKDLMIICMKPHAYTHPDISRLTNEHTHKAIEILTNLTQQFSEFLLSAPESKEKPDLDDVVTEDPLAPQEITVHPLFLDLISLLDDEKPVDETALSYLVKIVTSLSYQKPREVIIALFKQGNVAKQVFEHFYSRSIYEWFTRLLQIEDSASFYQKQKLMLFKECISSIDSEQNEQLLLQKLENYQSIFTVLLQKIDDRFDKAKFSSMVKQLLAEQECLACLFQKITAYNTNSQILEQILSIFEIYLRFSLNHRSINVSRNQENLENSIYEIRLNSNITKEIKATAISKSGDLLSLNTSKSLTRRYLELVKALIIFESDFVQEIITEKFVKQLVQIVVSNPNNNVLHNLFKEILIQSLNKSYQHTANLLKDQENNNFFSVVRKSHSEYSKTIQYQNQFYHIFQTLVKKGEDHPQFYQNLTKSIQDFDKLETLMKEKQKLYSKLIGGNARKESSSWGDSSAQIICDKIFPTNTNSDKKIAFWNPTTDCIEGNQNQHWFDCGGLPLDSDSSRDEASGNMDIENCLSPRSPTNFSKVPQILAKSQEQYDFPLKRENSDFKILLELPEADLVQVHNNSDLCIDPEESPPHKAQDKAELDGRSFNTFFVTYQSFQLEEVLSEIE